jgi:hypothetical protein
MKSFWTKLTRKVSGTPVVRFRVEYVLEAWQVCNLLARDVSAVSDANGIIEFQCDVGKWTTDFAKYVKEFTPSSIAKTIKRECENGGINATHDNESFEPEVVVACIIVATLLPTWAAGALAYGQGQADGLRHPNCAFADWFTEQKEALEKKFQNV